MNTQNNLGNLSTLTFGEIIRDRRGIMTWIAHCVGGVTLLGFAFLEMKLSPRAVNFLEIGVTLWLLWEWWAASAKKALPILPALLLIQGAFFLLPLFVSNPVFDNVPQETANLASLAVVVFYASAWAGWLAGFNIVKPRYSRFNFDFTQAGGPTAGLKLGLSLLGLNILFSAGSFEGWIWTLIRGDVGIYSILRSLADVCGLAGAFFGGLLIGNKQVPVALRLLFWILLVAVFSFSVAGLLLFGTVITMAAFCVGSVIAGRVPWKFLLIMAAVLSFLNFGKFPMRGKYLDPNGLGTSVTLRGLPSFYLEWANESFRLMGMKGFDSHEISITSQGDEGQPLYLRIDQMGSLLYITDIMRKGSVEPLNGATYTLIPPLLIPRILWPDKPISHGGQVLLNVYFGRQSLEQTATTFIAWGWLPEGIGNFGIWKGAVIIGLVLGIAFGMAERLSFSLHLLSVEGFVMLIFFMSVVNSYEMAASVFVTAAFQQTCSVLLGSSIIYLWLGRYRGRSRVGGKRQNFRPKRLQPATPNA